MDRKTLDAILAKHGVHVDGWHAGAGQFADLEIGVGAAPSTLTGLQAELASLGVKTCFRHVDNPDHPQHRQPYLEIASFWNE